MNKAAEQLYVSQPSLSASVKELEREIGIKIFNRSGRGVTLTNDGAEFFQYVRQVVGQFDVLAESAECSDSTCTYSAVRLPSSTISESRSTTMVCGVIG